MGFYGHTEFAPFLSIMASGEVGIVGALSKIRRDG